MTHVEPAAFREILALMRETTGQLAKVVMATDKESETGEYAPGTLTAELLCMKALDRQLWRGMTISTGSGHDCRTAGLEWAKEYPDVFAALVEPYPFLKFHIKNVGMATVMSSRALLELMQPADRRQLIADICNHHFVFGGGWVRLAYMAGMVHEQIAELVMGQVLRAQAECTLHFSGERATGRSFLIDLVYTKDYRESYDGFLPVTVPLRLGALLPEQLLEAMLVCAEHVPDVFLGDRYKSTMRMLSLSFGREAASEQVGKILDRASTHLTNLNGLSFEATAAPSKDSGIIVLSSSAKRAMLERVPDITTIPFRQLLWLVINDPTLFFALERLLERSFEPGQVKDYLESWGRYQTLGRQDEIAQAIQAFPEQVARVNAFFAQLARVNGCFLGTVESRRHGRVRRICVHDPAHEDICWVQHSWEMSYEPHEGDRVLVNPARRRPADPATGAVPAFMSRVKA